MPQDYKNLSVGRNRTRKKKPGRRNGILSIIAGLALATTAIIYFNKHPVIPAPLPPPEPAVEKATIDEKELPGKQSAEPKPSEPQFDFYQILPSKKVNISEWVAEEQDQAEINEPEPGIFVLQIGSFQEYDAADEIKAKLALIGIAADIQRVVINGQNIHHRVRAGPYKNLTELSSVRDLLIENDLDFVLLKLKMEDI